jgi:hypothetical protein
MEKFYINETLKGSQTFSGVVNGTRIDACKTDEHGNLHMTVGDKTVSASVRTSDYGPFYLVGLGEDTYLVTIGESKKEKRPYMRFKKGEPKQGKIPERQSYGT